MDNELFNEYQFSVDQLMELAGLSVAQAIAKTYPVATYDKPVICCGPGNNGGDGLVCARHLKLFGYSPVVICPKPGKTQLYQNLIAQCKRFRIGILDKVPDKSLLAMGNLIVDSVFGFSYIGPNRNLDYAKLLHFIHDLKGKVPLVSVDIPSGWDVENGCEHLEEQQEELAAELRLPALQPDCLVSLTAPKLCARYFKGSHHYIGGRFCPDSIKEKYQLNLPAFPGTDQIVYISK